MIKLLINQIQILLASPSVASFKSQQMYQTQKKAQQLIQPMQTTGDSYEEQSIPPGIFCPVLGQTSFNETPQAVFPCVWKNNDKQALVKVFSDCLFVHAKGQAFCLNFDREIYFGYSLEEEQIWFQQKETKDRARFLVKKAEQLQNFIQKMRSKCQQQHFNQYFTLLQQKGRGKNSHVFLAQRKSDSQILAVKTQKNSSKVQKQIQILKQLKHPNLIYLREYFVQPEGEVFIAMDYEDGGDLLQRMKSEIGYGGKLKVVIDMINALEFLRIKGIVHRDIKPQNIIYSEKDGNYKICDFGMAELVGEKIVKVCGTPGYMAPQLLKKDSQSETDILSDIYSMGLTFYELFTKKPYYEGQNSQEILQNNVKTTSFRKRSYPGDDPFHFEKKLLQKMIRSKPEDRKNSLQLMQSSIYSKISRLYGNQIQMANCRFTKTKSSGTDDEKVISGKQKMPKVRVF